MGALLVALFTLVLGFGMAAVAVILRGFVLHVLWGWFIVTTFHAPPIGIVAAWGASLVLSFAVDSPAPVLEGLTKEQKTARSVGVLLSPLVILLLGYLVHLFM